MFGEEPKILASFTKDPSDNYQDGLLELYKKLRSYNKYRGNAQAD